jgi:hypothetical protein
MTHTAKRFAFIALMMVSSLSSAQQGDDWQGDKWRFYIGGFWPNLSSEVAINADGSPPTPPVSIEDVLGVNEQELAAWGGLRRNFGKRHSLEFEYFSLNRDGVVSDTFDPPIEVSDAIIESASINTLYKTSVGRVTYGYSVISRERSRLDLKAGLHVASLEAELGFTGAVCDPTTTPSQPPGCPVGQSGVAAEDVAAPLPHLGASSATC